MRRMLLLVLAGAALAAPAAALADHGGGGGGNATYGLEGTLSAFTAAAGATNGSITILVAKGNGAGRAFVGQTLTFPVSAATRVESRLGGIPDGSVGKIQVKGPSGLDAAGLQALAPKKVEAKKAPPAPPGATAVKYKLEGTLSAFTAPVGATNGSITILVDEANAAGQPFVGQTLTFMVSSATEIEIEDGTTIPDGTEGEIELKGPAGLDAAGLQALTPKEIEAENEAEDD